jgi:hypothetical protein
MNTSSNTYSKINRRRFLGYFTASAASLALQACGGGASNNAVATNPTTPLIPPVPVAPPVITPAPTIPVVPLAPDLSWLTIPSLTFTEGIASSISMDGYLQGSAKVVSVLLNAVMLPLGVTYNKDTHSFEYDGRLGIGSVDGLVLTATTN